MFGAALDAGARSRPGVLQSFCPATGVWLWEGPIASATEVAQVVADTRTALAGWRETMVELRIRIARDFAALVVAQGDWLARLIARESGKPLWEARAEVAAIAGKVEFSIAAMAERAGETVTPTGFGRAVLRHRPHGVMAVLGPFNFPGHLPNGHIVPALLAGNVVIFKPSEHTPAVGEALVRLWAQAGLPPGVLALVQGGQETGAALVAADIDGVLFTGSARAGAALRRAMADRPGVILALELGGNNPLVAWDGGVDAIGSIVAASAFLSTGQRCSCARRLIIPEGRTGERIIEAVVGFAQRLRIGAWNDDPEPALGPLICDAAGAAARRAVAGLTGHGAKVLLPMRGVDDRGAAFVTPAILDVTGVVVPDEEIFAPVLQVERVADFAAAIAAANRTSFGLSAGLVSIDAERWQRFSGAVRAGVVNWNRPTTGAWSAMPFGGLGQSGNHRPSGYYAADYCAYPVASFEADSAVDLSVELRGLNATETLA